MLSCMYSFSNHMFWYNFPMCLYGQCGESNRAGGPIVGRKEHLVCTGVVVVMRSW